MNEKCADNANSSKNGDWINQLVLRGLKMGLGSEGADDEETVRVFEKLQGIMSIVTSRVEEVSNDLPWWCFISLIQLNESIKRHHPEYRDVSYRDGGEPVSTKELVELSEGVELAEWAYDEDYPILKKKLLSKDYVLLRHEMSCELGRVGHYIAINHKEKIALIGLKGTSTFSDLVTDATGSTVEYTLEGTFDESYTSNEIRCHEGIWNAALTMADDLEELVSNLFMPSRYKVLICGHSLGAGTACLLGILLRSRIPDLRGDKLQVLAIASPPVLNHEAALAASSFCTSVVNNNDIVPRMSLSNLVHLAKLLVHIESILQERGMKPHDIVSALRYVRDLMQSVSEPIMSCEEVDAFFDDQNDLLDHVDNLYVPGRVVTMWYIKEECKEEDNVDGDDKGRVFEGDDQASKEKVPQSNDEHAEATKGDDKKKKSPEEAHAERIEKEMSKIKDIDVVLSDGGARMLRQLELESSFLDDHRCEFYQASAQALLKKNGH